jgi:hypothetical protein
MTGSDSIRESFAAQADACRDLGSPFTAMLCEILARDLDRTTAFGRRILGWPGEPGPRGDALALRACGALARLAASGDAPDLAALFPAPPAAADRLAGVLAATLPRFDARLAADLDRVPQTNEIGRSAVLLGAALILAEEVGLPLELYELGAAAGLNLHFDRHAYDLGVGAWGDSRATIAIPSDWRGATPSLATPIEIAARAGCDLAPIDPRDPAARDAQLSWIWADQTERRRRTAAALDVAARHGITVERADAADWLEARLGERPRPGRLRLVYHTVVTQYLPEESRRRIDAALARAGAAASTVTPLAHLSMEADAIPGSAAVRLTVWPHGASREIARADFHGRHVAWNGARSQFAAEGP